MASHQSTDIPDLVGYVKLHDPVKYIQRHPGLIGEERVYAFIKVINRAGLDRQVLPNRFHYLCMFYCYVGDIRNTLI
jgi:hypothetical protein